MAVTDSNVGILSTSEVFQKKIAEIIQGLDDILVWGSTKEQHDARLNAVMERLQQAGLKLNEKKCLFGSTEVVFLGHLFSQEGVKLDPSKIEAIRNMPTPKSKNDLQRLLGMITYLGKFIPNLSVTTAQLMESDVAWNWSNHHNDALDQIKKKLTESPTLRYYDPELPTKTSVDESKFRLGAVLLQKHGDILAPVAYASRSLSKSEQTEKEALTFCLAVNVSMSTCMENASLSSLTINRFNPYLKNLSVKPRHEFNDFARACRNMTCTQSSILERN